MGKHISTQPWALWNLETREKVDKKLFFIFWRHKKYKHTLFSIYRCLENYISKREKLTNYTPYLKISPPLLDLQKDNSAKVSLTKKYSFAGAALLLVNIK